MSIKDGVTLLIVFGVGGYGFYGSVTGTGPFGWLNYAQQAVFGSYSVNVSILLALGVVGVLAVLARVAWESVFGSRDKDEQGIGSRILFGPKAAPATAPASQGRTLLQAAIIVVAATWTIGFALYWWYASEQREDASAQYEPLDLSGGAPLTRPRGSHIALRGGVPLDTVLIHRTGSGGSATEDYQLVPIARRGWVRGQPVVFVVKIKGDWELDPSPTPSALGNQGTARILMARIDGPVPVHAAQEFSKIGVRLDEPNYLLRPVKTRDGKVIMESVEEAFVFFLAACGILTAMTCAIMGGAWWIARAKAARGSS